MRDLTTGLATALAAGTVRPVVFVEAFFTSGPLRLWTGIGNLTWDGKTWLGVGWALAVAEIPETAQLQAQGVALTLSGIPTAMIARALEEIRQGLPCRIWQGATDDSMAVVADPYLALSGRMDACSVSEGVDTCSVTVTVESMLNDGSRPRERRYTDKDQQLYYAGDTGFQYVPAVASWSGQWGTGQGMKEVFVKK